MLSGTSSPSGALAGVIVRLGVSATGSITTCAVPTVPSLRVNKKLAVPLKSGSGVKVRTPFWRTTVPVVAPPAETIVRPGALPMSALAGVERAMPSLVLSG